MADKTTKKDAPKAEQSIEQQLVVKRNDLLEAKKSLAAGELINPRIITSTKKDIARLLTTLNASRKAK